MGDSDRALGSLKASADGGFSQPARLAGDTEWDSLRENPRFIELSKQVQHNAAPCEDTEFRAFDFWLGDWDVASAATGVHQGSSHVSKEMSGCVVWENWTSAGGPYLGRSYNTWNVNLKRWEQYWVDNAAGVIFFHGGIKDNVMDYWTDDVPQPTGGTYCVIFSFSILVRTKSGSSRRDQMTVARPGTSRRLHLHEAPNPAFDHDELVEQHCNPVCGKRANAPTWIATSHTRLAILSRRQLTREFLRQTTQV